MPNSTEPAKPGRLAGPCGCCGEAGEYLYWMDWDGPLSWLCSECLDQAIEEDARTTSPVTTAGEE